MALCSGFSRTEPPSSREGDEQRWQSSSKGKEHNYQMLAAEGTDLQDVTILSFIALKF